MKTSKEEILQMMQEEFNNMQEEAPISEVTRSEIEKMMEEEYSKMQDADPSVVEARKRPLKRDREAFARNQDMVSGLQKTITNYLKETGAKLSGRHKEVIETMSTRLMHVANSPMIKLSEGDATSRMITRLEDLGRIIQDALQYSENPESTERLERADQMVTELFDEMHNLL